MTSQPETSVATLDHHPRRRPTRLVVRAVAFVGLALIVAVGSQLIATAARPSPTGAPSGGDDMGGITPTGPSVSDLDAGSGATTADDADTDRIRANITFWGDRLTRHPNDFVAAQKLGESQIELARATGDLSAYLGADQSFSTALKLDPDLPAATAYRGVVLVSLHRFVDAQALARSVLVETPDDPTALATLGDSSLELGDVAGARAAYEHLARGRAVGRRERPSRPPGLHHRRHRDRGPGRTGGRRPGRRGGDGGRAGRVLSLSARRHPDLHR